MAIHGSPVAFTAIVSRSDIAIAFGKMAQLWPRFARFPDRKLENNITQPFVALLQVSAERQSWRFDFYYREKFAQGGAPVERGEGDIVIRPYPGGRSRRGFVIECKRLNVTYPSGFRDDAGKYVGTGGMGDFLCGKYDRNDANGGMLGYVMDNRVSAARSSVNRALKAKATVLRLEPPEELTTADFADERAPVFQTKHVMSAGDHFTIYHLFLPYDGRETEP